jgi:hypothetical protein
MKNDPSETILLWRNWKQALHVLNILIAKQIRLLSEQIEADSDSTTAADRDLLKYLVLEMQAGSCHPTENNETLLELCQITGNQLFRRAAILCKVIAGTRAELSDDNRCRHFFAARQLVEDDSSLLVIAATGQALFYIRSFFFTAASEAVNVLLDLSWKTAELKPLVFDLLRALWSISSQAQEELLARQSALELQERALKHQLRTLSLPSTEWLERELLWVSDHCFDSQLLTFVGFSAAIRDYEAHVNRRSTGEDSQQVEKKISTIRKWTIKRLETARNLPLSDSLSARNQVLLRLMWIKLKRWSSATCSPYTSHDVYEFATRHGLADYDPLFLLAKGTAEDPDELVAAKDAIESEIEGITISINSMAKIVERRTKQFVVFQNSISDCMARLRTS